MRVAILANDRASFVRPTAEGLQRMLRSCGAEVVMRYDGLHHLGLPTSVDWSSPRSVASTGLRLARIGGSFESSWKECVSATS